MAFSKTLPADVLTAIADDIGGRLQPASGNIDLIAFNGGDAPPGGLNLGETFEVWKLIPDALVEIADGNREIEALTRRAGLWHHQIRRNGKAIGFARSKPYGADAKSWSVRDIFISEMATKIDEAITYVDKYVVEEVEARLLSIPIQQVEAFWFVSDVQDNSWSNKVLIISTSDRIREFESLKEMSSEDFLAALVTEKRGMGVRPRSRSAPTNPERKGEIDMATKKAGKKGGGGGAGGPKSGGGGAGGGRGKKAGPGKAGGPKSGGGGAGGGKRTAKKK